MRSNRLLVDAELTGKTSERRTGIVRLDDLIDLTDLQSRLPTRDPDLRTST